MWHSDPSRLHRMLELLVAPNMDNLIPAVPFQALYAFSTGHKIRYTLFTHLSSKSLELLRFTIAVIQFPFPALSVS